MENKKNGNGLTIVLILVVVVLIVAVLADVLASSTNLKDIFSQTIVNKTEKEVTITDKGIADAVEKMYDSTVVVKVGTSSWGSGVVYKKDNKYGYILTNHHVVDGAKSITIMFTDMSEAEGTLIGSDEHADVAVVKVDANKIKSVAEIGSSEDLKLGDTVFAVGTPIDLAYSFTVTRGILSGEDRLVSMSSKESGYSYYYQTRNTDVWYMKLIQIDASINSGNSGGPLANSNGEIIGITNSKLSSSGSYYSSSATIENMGFAIPI
jgi:serine protease Do